MEKRKLKAILDEILIEMNRWQKLAIINGCYKLRNVAHQASMHLVFYAGRKDMITYVGSWKVCQQLQLSCGGGKIFRSHYNWCWQNYTTQENVNIVLGRFPTRITLRYKFNSQPEIDELLPQIFGHLKNIILFGKDNCCSCIADWSLCERLRRRFGGCVAVAAGGFWMWSAHVEEVVVKEYICRTRKMQFVENAGMFASQELIEYCNMLLKETALKQPSKKCFA